jgi:hypothetical protein
LTRAIYATRSHDRVIVARLRTLSFASSHVQQAYHKAIVMYACRPFAHSHTSHVSHRARVANKQTNKKQTNNRYHVAVMPCYDKKLEASRDDFYSDIFSSRDVDCVITTGELETMMQDRGVSLMRLTMGYACCCCCCCTCSSCRTLTQTINSSGSSVRLCICGDVCVCVCVCVCVSCGGVCV